MTRNGKVEVTLSRGTGAIAAFALGAVGGIVLGSMLADRVGGMRGLRDRMGTQRMRQRRAEDRALRRLEAWRYGRAFDAVPDEEWDVGG